MQTVSPTVKLTYVLLGLSITARSPVVPNATTDDHLDILHLSMLTESHETITNKAMMIVNRVFVSSSVRILAQGGGTLKSLANTRLPTLER